ncbi:MAG: alpha/beta hydrolase [Imperialibacter sp.]|uniref:alpha/beta fold hydrolase n=1 Tax=Imperialibacter sp. TaxID=2038411 RepID=UPI0032EEDCC9
MYRIAITLICVVTHSISAMSQDNTIQLRDGRLLGFAEYGRPDGIPFIYFHGGQESRLSSCFMDSVAAELGIRIISPERPGIGLSTFQPNRTFLDWASDIEDLANCLNIDSFSVFGLSGGAPHVLACLQVIPTRIVNASIIAGAAPYDYDGSLKGMWLPVKIIHWFASMKSDKLLRKFIEKDAEDLVQAPEKRIKQFQNYLPNPDKTLMKNQPEYGWDFIEGSREAYQQGVDGVVQEWQLYVADWHIDLSAIQQRITLWYGAEDKMAPYHRGRYYQKHLPNAHLHEIKDEAHFSLIRTHLKEILLELRTTKKDK